MKNTKRNWRQDMTWSLTRLIPILSFRQDQIHAPVEVHIHIGEVLNPKDLPPQPGKKVTSKMEL
jgi:hypothetical protein